jgi:hypothetical protein
MQIALPLWPVQLFAGVGKVIFPEHIRFGIV